MTYHTWINWIGMWIRKIKWYFFMMFNNTLTRPTLYVSIPKYLKFEKFLFVWIVITIISIENSAMIWIFIAYFILIYIIFICIHIFITIINDALNYDINIVVTIISMNVKPNFILMVTVNSFISSFIAMFYSWKSRSNVLILHRFLTMTMTQFLLLVISHNQYISLWRCYFTIEHNSQT